MILRLVGVLMAAATAVSAQGPELTRSRAEFSFQAAGMPADWTSAVHGAGAPLPQGRPLVNVVMAPVAGRAAPSPSAQEIELAPWLNRHLKTSEEFILGGKKTWVSGSFDKDETAFASILVEGEAPRFFWIRGLADKEAQMVIGNATYKINVAGVINDPLSSDLIIKNVANRKDKESLTIREILAAVYEAGVEVKAGDQTYRASYYQVIKDRARADELEGQPDPASLCFAFILKDEKEEFHVFRVLPSQLNPDEQVIFKMYRNHPLGIQAVGGKLRVVDNPK